ncbi:uncharacterized protein LOC103716510 [Phoenix dactylifera]|uniref:Uncharacterized protein LOC103716510 n=1 Tax=Phoenix dactylifera TaxID=42345 RepID=A0A8B7CN47_PHODC|nr:uncharacterized protein LOC103716510 [Phoenix dactylifera]
MTIYGNIIHPMHPDHVLKLEQEETPYTCNGCGELGFNSRYTCEEKSCNFHLHKDCATPEDIITHPFFPGCSFHFLQSGEPDRFCDACGRDIKGFVYHCFDKKWDLHPSCASLPHVMEEAEVKLVLHRKVSSKCCRCRKKELRKGARSWSYVSTCKECHLHVACVKEILLENWENEHLGDGRREVKAETKDSLVLKSTAPKLQIVLEKKRSKSGKFAKFKKIAKIAITFIMAAVVGDPTALVAGLIASLIAH